MHLFHSAICRFSNSATETFTRATSWMMTFTAKALARMLTAAVMPEASRYPPSPPLPDKTHQLQSGFVSSQFTGWAAARPGLDAVARRQNVRSRAFAAFRSFFLFFRTLFRRCWRLAALTPTLAQSFAPHCRNDITCFSLISTPPLACLALHVIHPLSGTMASGTMTSPKK